MNENLYKALVDALGEGKIQTGDMIGSDYCHDELPGGASYTPDAVIEAASTEDISAVLKLCNEYDTPVTVRGAGTGQVGGSVAVKGGVILSVKGMDKVVSYDEEAKTLTVQPGMLLQAVKAEAESHGMYYPPDPGELTATIGGNVATNAAGPCAVKYGATRDYVVDAVIVLADGTVTNLKGGDYDAVVGSEGTLAVISEVTLKLIEKPGADAILLFPFLDNETCLAGAQTILGTEFAPATVEYMDTDIVEFSGNVTGNPVFPVEMDGDRVAATLMVTLEAADDDAVMEMMEAIAEMAEDIGCVDILVGDTPTMKRDFWTAHDAFHTSMESGAKCANEINIDVPTEHIAEMIDFAKAEGEAKGLKVMAIAHVGSGGMHIHAVADCSKEEFAAAFGEFADAVYAKCTEFGGNVAAEYGIGYAKIKYLSDEEKAANAAAKAALDPKGILNPGKRS